MQSCPQGRSRRGRAVVVCFLSSMCIAAAARGQAPPSESTTDVDALRAEIAALRADYEQRLAALEQKLDALQSAAVSEVPVAELPPPTTPPAEAPASATGQAQTSNYFNPAISLVGNFLATAGHNEVEELPSFDLRESELGLQAVVDPYARADVFIAFGEEGAAVEEGFVTFTSLPAGLLAKVGRIRAPFGKINPLHLHVLPWADAPLPIQNLLGGDEGWAGDGLTVARLVPLPADTFSEATVAVFRGEREGLFEEEKRSDLAYGARYRVFRDLTEATNLDLGVSWGQGPNATEVDLGDEGVFTARGKTRLTGFDATLRWKPLQTASYRSFTARGEVIRSRREQPGGDASSLGWFVSGDWQLARRWSVGGRYESADHADDDALTDSGQALLLTFRPSEFSLLRAEYRRRRYELLDDDFLRTDSTANELLVQLQFAIGAHGAHPF